MDARSNWKIGSTGGVLRELASNGAYSTADFMLETFSSVGAVAFDLTVTNSNGDKKTFRKAVPVAKLRQNLPSILDRASNQQLNVIVRPVPGSLACRAITEDAARRAPVFLQLDDLDDPSIRHKPGIITRHGTPRD